VKTMAFEITGTTIILVHTAEPPSKDEWDRYIRASKELLDRAGAERVHGLVVTEGGGPSISQRQQVNDMLKLRPLSMAVVSSNAFIRTIVTALNVFNPSIKVFRPDALAFAFRHLGLSEQEKKTALRTVAKLQAELGIKSALRE
jgi:hypothetical protein